MRRSYIREEKRRNVPSRREQLYSHHIGQVWMFLWLGCSSWLWNESFVKQMRKNKVLQEWITLPDSLSTNRVGRSPGGGHGNPLQYSVIHKESDTKWLSTRLRTSSLTFSLIDQLIFLTTWLLSFLTRDWTWAMAVKAPSPNHWTACEFPQRNLLLE